MDGVIVGEGFHPKAGQPHAEVFALRDAGELAENATAYNSHFHSSKPLLPATKTCVELNVFFNKLFIV
ncbi:putative diaminohydroxyphosphoribosylaminopyrimidine deaminase [Helianthus annuus]|nr:putative diaminohydroxyphosphoribosylaminopyrimidine deaminase [Helianthus annuus]